VTTHYKMPSVYIQVTDHNQGAGATMTTAGLLRIKSDRLGLGAPTEWLIAHELGHYVLGHTWSANDSAANNARKEMEANGEAVKVGAIGSGLTEDAAYRRVHDNLWHLERSIQRGTRTVPRGHAPICDEINNLIERYPQYTGTRC
jgi:hypothetical protein